MERTKNIILDTDMGPDCDDAGAVAIMNKLCDFGEVRPLAMGNCTVYQEGAACISAINWYYGRPEIPVGTLKRTNGPGAGNPEDYLKYNKFIAENFNHSFLHTIIPDVISVYREALVRADNDSVTIITIGMFNNISNLLKSPPDSISQLNGTALVEKKVKRIVSMAGNFREGNPDFFSEFNINTDIQAAKYVLEHFGKEIVFCPYEMGYPILTGSRLISMGDMKRNPVAKAYKLYCGDAGYRNSWDLVAVYYAVRGTHGMFRESKPGVITIDDNGFTYFNDNPNGNHYITANRVPPMEIAQILEDILNLTPELVR